MNVDLVLSEYFWIVSHRGSSDVNHRIAKMLLSFATEYPLPSTINGVFDNVTEFMNDPKNIPTDVFPLVIFRDLIHNQEILYDRATTLTHAGVEVNPFSLFSRKYYDLILG